MSDDSTLTIKNVVSVLRDITARWEDIGLGLRFDNEKLKVIKADFKNNSRCLTEVIHLWFLRERYPSWSTIINVLHKIGENTCADDVEHYITELKRISEHQSVTDHYCKRLVPASDFSYEDWWLQRIQFETDPLNQVTITKEDAVHCLLQDAAEWYDIGIALEIPKNELDIIEKDNDDCEAKMFVMISRWTHSMVEVQTWRTLVDALKQQGMHKVADHAIEKASNILRETRKIYATLTQSIPKRNWKKMDENRRKFKETVKLMEQKQENSSLLENIRTILNIPSPVSDSSLLDNLTQHIINKGKMTKNEVLGLLKTINKIGEDFIEYPDLFTKQAEKVKKELTEVNQHIHELRVKKQSLEHQQSTFNIEIERIETELKNTPPKDYFIRPSLNELNNGLIKARANLKIASTRLCDCTQELETAKRNHDIITKDILNIKILESCLRQYEQLQNMSKIYSDKRVLKIFLAAMIGAGIGAGVGAVLGVVAGGPPGFVVGAFIGGGIGALVGSIGFIGFIHGTEYKREVDRMLMKVQHTHTQTTERIQQIQKLIDEITTPQNETEPPIYFGNMNQTLPHLEEHSYRSTRRY